MKSRIVIIFVVLIGLWSVLILRAANLQVQSDQRLADLQKRTFKKVVTLKSRRGAIVDRHGKGLAVTIPSYSLYIDPKIIKQPKKVAKVLSREVGVSQRSIRNKIKKRNRFAWVKRHLTKDHAQKIRNQKLSGVGFIEEPLRVYPNRNLFSQALGFVGSEGRGLEGLELEYDNILQGEKRKVRMRRDAHGRPLLINGKVFTDFPEGASLQLTLDSELQYVLERELSTTMEKHQAQSAVGVVLDAKTSEILALAHAPTFNLNKAADYAAEWRRIRSVTDPFEPGSTMKTFVVATAIKEKIVQPNSKFFCENGKMKVGRRTIKDADDKHKFGWLTVSDILTHSSNIGMTKIAFKMGDKVLHDGLKDFGFGQRTEIGLPGERKGIVKKLPWREHFLSNVSFGHGMTATPLQIAAGYAAIANGGVLKQPRLIDRIYNIDTGDEKKYQSEIVRRVLTEEQATTVRMMLTSASPPTAKIPGFQVAGKTGTAQKVDTVSGGYLAGKYVSSFAGFVPANDPRFVIYIAIDSPRKKYYGAEVAAPIFANVAKYSMRKTGMAPVTMALKDVVKTHKKKRPIYPKGVRTIKEALNEGITPNFEGLSLREVLRSTRGADLQVDVRGRGQVYLSSPSPGLPLKKSKKVTLYLKPQAD